MSRSVECLLKGIGTYERSGAIVLVFFEYRLRDVYPLVGDIEFLASALGSEDMAEVLGCERLVVGWVKRWQGLVGHVCLDVVPLCWDLFLCEDEFLLFHIFFLLLLPLGGGGLFFSFRLAADAASTGAGGGTCALQREHGGWGT